jgi:DNA-binding CsgD family transcriptional regulator
MADALERLQNAVWHDANASPDLVSFRRSVVVHLATAIGYDNAIVAPAPSPLGDDDPSDTFGWGYDSLILQRWLENRERYYRGSLRPFVEAMAANGGLAINTDVYTSRELETLDMCVEIHIPAGTTSCLSAALAFRGHSTCTLVLNRTGRSRRFGARDLERMRAFLPLLGVADAAVAARCGQDREAQAGREPPAPHAPPGLRGPSPERIADSLLTPREREVVSLIRLGLRNKQIAAALGTSVDTVRKQTVSAYEKLGVAGRVQLVARFGDNL